MTKYIFLDFFFQIYIVYHKERFNINIFLITKYLNNSFSWKNIIAPFNFVKDSRLDETRKRQGDVSQA